MPISDCEDDNGMKNIFRRLKIESDNGAFPTLKKEINCYRFNLCFLRNLISLTVKKVRDFPVPSRDVTNQTLPGKG